MDLIRFPVWHHSGAIRKSVPYSLAMLRVTIRFDEETTVRLKHRARELGCSVTEVARLMVEENMGAGSAIDASTYRLAVHNVRQRAFVAVSNALRDLEKDFAEELRQK